MFIKVTLDLLVGFWTTFKVFALTLAFSLPLGLIIAFGSMSRFRPIKYVCKFIVWVIRGTPLMLQLITVYYGPGLIGTWAQGLGSTSPFIAFLASWKVFDRFLALMVAFIINYACYFSEIYRGGIESIPRGQYEAAEVLGYSRVQTFMKIVLPQVIKRILPAMGNEIITLVKDTSLAFAIGVAEMFSTAKALVASQVSMLPFVFAAVFYWVFNFIVEVVLNRIEKKLDYYHD